MSKTDEGCVTCLLLLAIVAVAIAVGTGITFGLASLICYVSSGLFGHDLAYWPTWLAAVVLVQVTLGLLQIRYQRRR